MAIRLEREEGRLTIQLEGRLDTNTATELNKIVDDEIQGLKEMVFDLQNLVCMSTEGIAIFTRVTKTMRIQKGVVTVCNANKRVMAAFKVAELDIYLNFK